MTSVASAFQAPLSDEAVREAYFLGQRRDDPAGTRNGPGTRSRNSGAISTRVAKAAVKKSLQRVPDLPSKWEPGNIGL